MAKLLDLAMDLIFLLELPFFFFPNQVEMLPHICQNQSDQSTVPFYIQLGHRWRCLWDTVWRDRVGFCSCVREGGQEESVHPLPRHHVLRKPAVPLHHGCDSHSCLSPDFVVVVVVVFYHMAQVK